MRKRTVAREFAMQMLYQQEMNPSDLSETIEMFWQNQEPEAEKDIREFAEDLVRGTEKNLKHIDAVISQAVQNWEIGRIAVLEKNIIRFSVYELLYRDDIPPKVTINEAVNLAKKFSQEESGKFVNGVLDKISHTHPSKSSADE